MKTVSVKSVLKIGLWVVVLSYIVMVASLYHSAVNNEELDTNTKKNICDDINNDTVTSIVVIYNDNTVEEYTCE